MRSVPVGRDRGVDAASLEVRLVLVVWIMSLTLCIVPCMIRVTGDRCPAVRAALLAEMLRSVRGPPSDEGEVTTWSPTVVIAIVACSRAFVIAVDLVPLFF